MASLDGNRVLSALHPLFLNALCGWLGAGCWKVWKQEVIPAFLDANSGNGRGPRQGGLCRKQAAHLWILLSPSRSKKGAKRTW